MCVCVCVCVKNTTNFTSTIFFLALISKKWHVGASGVIFWPS